MEELSIIERVLAGDFGEFFGAVIFALLVAIASFLVAQFSNYILSKFVKKHKNTNNGRATILAFLRHLIASMIYLFGFIIIVESIPEITSAVKTVMTAGGLIAVVAGFAAQEALGNIIGGILILVYKPFVIGDVVKHLDSGIFGKVEEINLHHTSIRTNENKHIIIPNNKMNTSVIENADYLEQKVCNLLEIGISYESDLKLAKRLFAEVVAADPNFLDVRTEAQKKSNVPIVDVIVVELGESAVKLRAPLWAKDNGTAFALKCSVQEDVKRVFEQNGVDIAYPHLVVKPG